MLYVRLFLEFFKAGLFAVGGGYAMLPMLQKEVVEKRGWATEDELMDYYAVGQCTPGVIAVNTATFIGSKQKGILGSIFATAGVISPSILIIGIIAAFIRNFAELAAVKNAFAGIRVCVCVLIFNAVAKLYKKAVIDLPTTVIFVLVFLGSVLFDVSPAVYVVLSGAAGILIRNLGAGKGGK